MRKPGIAIGIGTAAVLLTGAVAATTASADTAPGTRPGAQPGARPPAAPAAAGVQGDVLDLVNAARRRHGCPDLGLDGRLAAAAHGHARDMADRGYFAHRSPAGGRAGDRISAEGYRWARFAENIARGQDSAAEVVDDWMHSPSHRDNILDCSLLELGVGRAFDTGGTPYWVQNFASPR